MTGVQMIMAKRVGKLLFFIVVGILAGIGAASLIIAYRTAPIIWGFAEEAAVPVAPDTDQFVIGDSTEERYLDLMKRYLTRYDFDEYKKVASPLDRVLAPRRLALVQVVPMEQLRKQRAEGRYWPPRAETMIGLRRLDNIEYCIRDVLRQHVPGDVIEAGAWRGGATIFMRAVLKTYGGNERKVWVADSFEGLPKPDSAAYPADAGSDFSNIPELAVSLDEVKHNFARYGLLDDQVRFLKGWFKDTLPTAPIDHLAVLRVDGDLYESTMEALRYLYPKVSAGGYVIDDDYGALSIAKKAVDDFRAANGITAELKQIDWTGVYWQKAK
jgi:O-methyltransferase